MILSLNRKIQVRENWYSRLFYAVFPVLHIYFIDKRLSVLLLLPLLLLLILLQVSLVHVLILNALNS